MCGILAVIRRDGRRPDHEAVTDALAKQESRGPDANHITRPTQNIAFGFNRLAIQDLTDNAMQPITLNNTTLLYNGELYNKDALSDDLNVNDQSDTRVLLHGLDQHGPTFIQRCNGIFSICYHNGHELILIRDRLGVKPLYHAATDTHRIIASDLRSIQAYTDLHVNTDQLKRSVLLDWTITQGPRSTYFDNVTAVPPATMQRLSTCGDIKQSETYWERTFQTRRSHDQDAFTTTLQETMKKELTSDTPVGVMLSGGIDTTTNLTHAVKHLNQDTIPVHTFYHDKTSPDKANAEASVQHLDPHGERINHEKTELNTPLTYDNFLQTTKSLGWPILDVRFITFHQLYSHVNTKVVLSGMGSDEVYYGYYDLKDWFSELYRDEFTADTALALYDRINTAKHDHFKPGFKRQAKQEAKSFLTEHIARSNAPTKEQRITSFLGTTYLPAVLTLEDKASMAHGVEARVPLINPVLVNHADNHAHTVHTKTNTAGRTMLREALRGQLPDTVVDRGKHPTPRRTNIRRDLQRIIQRRHHDIKTNGFLQDIYKDDILHKAAHLPSDKTNAFFGDTEHLLTEIIGLHAFHDAFLT